MKVLVVDEELSYPANSGKRLRSYNLIRQAARWHGITLVAYAKPPLDSNNYGEYEKAGVRVVTIPPPRIRKDGLGLILTGFRNLAQREPVSVAAYRSDVFRREIFRVIRQERIDLVHCELGPFGHFVSGIRDIPTVLDAHNFEAEIWEQLTAGSRNPLKKTAFSIQATRMLRYEKTHYPKFDRVLCVSREDREKFRDRLGLQSVSVVPNGVDIGFFGGCTTRGRGCDMLFCGALDWRPTQDCVKFFLDAILPDIRTRCPDVTLTVLGRQPPKWLRQYVSGFENVELAADVPDVRSYYEKASVCVVPLRVGSGSRLKILEAFAMGRPVVSTTIGAEGLEVVPGRHLAIADSPRDFAEEVVKIVNDPSLAEEMADSGRKLVEEKYDWEKIGETLSSAWRNTLSNS